MTLVFIITNERSRQENVRTLTEKVLFTLYDSQIRLLSSETGKRMR